MEGEDHLYLTLPSSASMELYPDNKISDYKTELLHTIQLDREKYEVGLSEIILDADIENVTSHSPAFTIFRSVDFVKKNNFNPNDIERLTPTKIDNKEYYSETISINRGLYKSLSDILRNFNRILSRSRISYDLMFTVKKLSSETAEIVSLRSNAALDLQDTSIFYFRPLKWFRRCIKPIGNLLVFKNDGYFKFDHEAFVHGVHRYFPTNTEVLTIETTSLHFICEPDDLLQDPGMAYVYTDIIDHQHVGDTKASLLRVVHFSKGKRVITFPDVHYLSMSKTHLQSIRIYIRDVEGNNYPFTRGTAVCKVHIRRKLR